MESRDLRVGNYLLYNDRMVIVDEILFEGINLTHEGAEYKYRDLKPIELTEEYILDCGFQLSYFKDSIRQKSYKIYSKEFIKITEEDGLFVLVKPYDNVSLTSLAKPFKHLHQLQNLYYCLVGEELNIKL